MPVDPSGKSHIDKLDNFSRNEIGSLTKLTVDHTHCIEDTDSDLDAKITQVLNRILEASAASLDQLTLCNPIGYLPGTLKIPLMPKVTGLNLFFNWWGENATFNGHLRGGELFPRGFKFKSSFPNLRDVDINLETEIGIKYRFDMWKNCLKSVGIARSVRQLEYSDDCGFKKEQLKKTFPKASWARSPSPDLTDTSPPPSDEDSSDFDN